MQNQPVVGRAVPQVQGELSFFDHIGTTGAIPEQYLDRLDNLGALAFITRGHTRFLHMLHTKVGGKSITVKTREPHTHQIDELDRVLPIAQGSSAVDNHNRIALHNAHGAQLQPNDVVYINGLYHAVAANGTSSWSSLYGLIGGTFFVDYEQCLVLRVDSEDSAGTGQRWVYLRRAYASRGAGDRQGGFVDIPTTIPANGAITPAHTLLRGLPSFPEGGNAPKGFHKNALMDNNFTQEFKYAVEITKESTIEKTRVGKSQLEINKLLRARMMALDIERTFIFGRKGKTMDNLGRVQYNMGGVLEYIIRDEDHIFSYRGASITYPGILDMLNKIARSGCSTKLTGYCGISLYTEFKKAFYNSGFLEVRPEDSDEFNITVETLVGPGIDLRLVPLYSLEEAGFHNKMLILDLENPSFVPVTHEGWDMKVEKDIQEKGAQVYKEQWVGIKGLQRRYAQYHHLVDFPIQRIF